MSHTVRSAEETCSQCGGPLIGYPVLIGQHQEITDCVSHLKRRNEELLRDHHAFLLLVGAQNPQQMSALHAMMRNAYHGVAALSRLGKAMTGSGRYDCREVRLTWSAERGFCVFVENLGAAQDAELELALYFATAGGRDGSQQPQEAPR